MLTAMMVTTMTIFAPRKRGGFLNTNRRKNSRKSRIHTTTNHPNKKGEMIVLGILAKSL